MNQSVALTNTFIILIVIIIFTISTVQGYCPSQCNCGEYAVVCMKPISELEFQRLGNETETRRVGLMIFKNQNITSLDMCLFKRFTSVGEFIFTFSALKTVPKNPGCIPGFGIQKLKINNNEIGEISEDDFKGCERINNIWLSGNKIKRVRPRTFTKLKSIVDLRLDNNEINQIDSDAFEGLKDLTMLYLHDNRLTTIQNNVFQSIKRIGVLLLNNNQLTDFASTAFAHLQFVQLNLRNNKIKDFPPQVFQNTSIVSIQLHLNPLHCSCQALLTLTNIQDMAIAATCATPLTFKSQTPSKVIELVTDPCSNTLHCVDEDPQLIEDLNNKQQNKTIVCSTPAPEVKSQWPIIQICLISIGVLFTISILSFVIGYNYKKRVTGVGNVSSEKSVKMKGFTASDGSYIRDQNHYVETLDEEESKEVTIKSVRRKISTAFFGPQRKQSLTNLANMENNNRRPVAAVERKKTVFQSPPVIKEEEHCNGVNNNKAFEMEDGKK